VGKSKIGQLDLERALCYVLMLKMVLCGMSMSENDKWACVKEKGGQKGPQAL
jgi:hypothetical protein